MIGRAVLLLVLAAACATAFVVSAASARDAAVQRAHERTEALADERASRLGELLEDVESSVTLDGTRQRLAERLSRHEAVALVPVGTAPADLPADAALRRVARIEGQDLITWAAPEIVHHDRTTEWIALVSRGSAAATSTSRSMETVRRSPRSIA